jgi:NAD(P)-dependent dehydrogenase (short-subunit alcohol dehydrogenase family)
VRGWCAALVERFGRVDGVVHLVGGWRGGQPLHEAPLADWALLHDLLVRTVQHTTRAFYEQIAASPHGRFVLVSAKQAQAPSNTNAAYAAAKAAAEAWTLAFADGFEPGGATANIIVVEAILTPRMREENPEGDYARFTLAEDLAAAIAFVCSDAAAKMNGQRLPLTMG